jgi:glucuronokinase
MQTLAGLADQGLEALQHRDYTRLGDLMDTNFATRRRLYGDAVVGAVNIRAVELARELGFSAKFTGSGGAIVCMYREQSTEW